MPCLKDHPSEDVDDTPTDNEPSPIAQPRHQPQNLESLLRYAVEATAPSTSSSNVTQLNEDDARFLQNALQSMTVDVNAILNSNIAILRNMDDIQPSSDVGGKLQSFQTLLDCVDSIDVANNFHKVGGFDIFLPCMLCNHPKIRSHVCDLIGVLAQNNPYIQDVICESPSLMTHLVQLLGDVDENEEVRIKALYAISCITRESSKGFETLRECDGFLALKTALMSESNKMRTKSAFLLCNLSHSHNSLINMLVDADYVPVLVKALQTPHQSSHEQILALLLQIAQNSSSALRFLQQSADFQSALAAIRIFIANDASDQFVEEEEYCAQFEGLLN